MHKFIETRKVRFWVTSRTWWNRLWFAYGLWFPI